MQRRLLFKTVTCLAATGVFATARTITFAQNAGNYPSRPIRLLVGMPPGGPTDIPIRVLAENASRILGAPVIVENKPGAGGVLPAQMLQGSSPDGYTVAVIPTGVFRLPYRTKINWDPLTDITYVIGISGYAFGIVVSTSSPISTWKQYVEYAKANPGQLTYGSSGIASTNHLTMEQISRELGIKLNHVPYKGSAESVRALMGGEIQSVADTSAWAPYVESGKLRLLAVWSEQRLSRFPNAPTLKELGLNIVRTSPWGLGVSKGVEPAVVKKLHDAFKQAMEMPNFLKSLAHFDMVPAYMDSNRFRQFAAESMKQEKEILGSLGLLMKE